MIAAAAEEISLQSLRGLVNASKPAGATSIFLFLIGSPFPYTPHHPLFFWEPCEMLALDGGDIRLNWWCDSMKQVVIIFQLEHSILSLWQSCWIVKGDKGIEGKSKPCIHCSLCTEAELAIENVRPCKVRQKEHQPGTQEYKNLSSPLCFVC